MNLRIAPTIFKKSVVNFTLFDYDLVFSDFLRVHIWKYESSEIFDLKYSGRLLISYRVKVKVYVVKKAFALVDPDGIIFMQILVIS